MYKYLFFIICGIILFLLWNKYDGFSIGIPTYVLLQNTNGSYSIEEAGGGSDGTQTLLWTGELDIRQYGEVNEYIHYNEEDPRNIFYFLGGGELMLDSTSNEHYRKRLKSIGISNGDIDTLIDATKVRNAKLSFACASHSRLGMDSHISILSMDLVQSILLDPLLDPLLTPNIFLIDLINILENTKVFYETLSREHSISLDNIYYIFLRFIVLLLIKGYNVELITGYINNNLDSTFLDEYLDNYNSDNNLNIVDALYSRFTRDNS